MQDGIRPKCVILEKFVLNEKIRRIIKMNKIILRPYQLRVLNQLWAAMQRKNNILAVLPCSAGKTIIFSKIIQRLLKENESFRCLILVDREILVSQSHEKLVMVAPELKNEIGIACASIKYKKDTTKRVTIASRQTLINQLDDLAGMQLVICDEAHLIPMKEKNKQSDNQYGKILQALWILNPKMRLFGCTASPYRLGQKGGYIYGQIHASNIIPYFEAVDAFVSNKEMIDAGFIVPLKGYARISQQIETDLSEVDQFAGEYNLKQLTEVMTKELHITACVTAFKEFAKNRKKTVIFCTTIEHCEKVTAAFKSQNIPALSIHSKLSKQEIKERMAELAAETGIKVFTSVAKLTTGMDIDIIDCIILARPTKSTALFQQIIGRGQRLANDKKDCLILDLVGNISQFGTDMDKLYVPIPKGSGGGEAPTKICPGEKIDGTVCGQQLHAAVLVCPECGYKFPKKETQDKLGIMEPILFKKTELAPPKWCNVDDMGVEIWDAKSGKRLLKITLYLVSGSDYARGEKVPVWCCFEDYYSGYALEKGFEKWQQFTDEPYPSDVDAAFWLKDTFLQPYKVQCQRKEDGYLEAKDFKFKEIEPLDDGDVPF